ncbi:MAG TPA: cytochrome c-type biogenesis protein CcmH [Ktedonobacteraceae bacterium]|nr:cytochrome c-type biogenesis protein CcmH [Ktedonobacteraceae bacterium]
MKKQRALLLVVAIVMILVAIWSYVLLVAPASESLDQREHDVASQLKCPVCQGESVADSPSTISQQMRGVIRQQLQQGQSEQQIIQYFVSRYGNSILWSPPKQGFTMLAWIIPIAILLGGALLLMLVLRGWLTAGRASRRAVDEDGGEPLDLDDLQQFQAQLEQELAADDPMFARMSKEEHKEARATARVAPTIDEARRAGNVSKEVGS